MKIYKNLLKKEYKNMMELQIVIINSLQILLIPTKLILVSLRQFPTFLMTKKSQFNLEPITQDNPRSSTNLFTINPSNPQQVIIKNTKITILGSGSIYDLNDPDLQNFITNTQFDRQLENVSTSLNFLNDMKYNINYGDKKSMRYYFIKDLIKQYYQQSAELSAELSTELPNQVGSGLNGEAARSYARKLSRSISQSYARSYTNQYVFLPSDPDELVDQIKLLYFEKFGGNDSFLLNEQIIAIVDKLLEYECITTSQHQNILSNFDSTSV